MSIYQACQDVRASRLNEYISNTGHSAGISYQKLDSYSPILCARSPDSADDAVTKLNDLVHGYCANRDSCSPESGITVNKIGFIRLFFERIGSYIFGYRASQM